MKLQGPGRVGAVGVSVGLVEWRNPKKTPQSIL